MKFSVTEEVAVPPDQVMAAYGSPAFYESRDDIAVFEAVAHDGVVEVHYAFRGSVTAAVRAVVDPAKLSWVTRTEFHPAEGRATWEVQPDHYPDRLRAHGGFRFAESTSSTRSTVVTVDGDLKVHVPVVGRSVERVIVSGLRRYLEAEVASVPDFVAD